MGSTEETRTTIQRFNDAFNRHDLDAIMNLMTDDVVFENTAPPDGERFTGQEDVRAFWMRLFEANPRASFDSEDIVATGDRCVVTWLFTFDKGTPGGGHVRGVDVFRVRDGRVAEKLSYVKG